MDSADKALADKRMSKALTQLVLSGDRYEFFASLALNLRMQADDTIDTACTDGVYLKYNPDFVNPLTIDELKGLIAHEVLHVAYGHIWRMDLRNHKKWNIACDYEINHILKNAGFILPQGALLDSAYEKMSAESVYRTLPKEEEGEEGTGYGDFQLPDSSDGNTPASEELREFWETKVTQEANKAEKRGSLPQELNRLVKRISIPACRDLVEAILQWASRSARNDYSWNRPNRRFIQNSIYMPTMHSVETPPIVACVDTSGSITDDILQRFTAAIQQVLDICNPETLTTIACDARIHEVVEYVSGDIINDKFSGGGGTDFIPALEKAQESSPCGCIYLTDLYGRFPATPPEFPVLWVCMDKYSSREVPPFGETLYVE